MTDAKSLWKDTYQLCFHTGDNLTERHCIQSSQMLKISQKLLTSTSTSSFIQNIAKWHCRSAIRTTKQAMFGWYCYSTLFCWRWVMPGNSLHMSPINFRYHNNLSPTSNNFLSTLACVQRCSSVLINSKFIILTSYVISAVFKRRHVRKCTNSITILSNPLPFF